MDVYTLGKGAVESTGEEFQIEDQGALEGALGATRTAYAYGEAGPDIFGVAAELINKLQRLQAIRSGNKRTASAVGLHFLKENGYRASAIFAEEHLLERFIGIVAGLSDREENPTTSDDLAEFLRRNVPAF